MDRRMTLNRQMNGRVQHNFHQAGCKQIVGTIIGNGEMNKEWQFDRVWDISVKREI